MQEIKKINLSLEWDVTTIGELCSNVSSGGTPKSTNEEYYGGNIPWLNTKEINFNRIYDTEKHITNEGFKNSAAKWVKKDSVIVAMYGATAAKVAMNMVDLTTNQACCNLTIDKSLANPKFVYYYLYSNYERLLNLASGAAQQNLNSNIIKEFPINIPSLNVQNEIVNLLSTIDDKIELNQKINKNLEELAKAIYRHHFIDFKPYALGGLMKHSSQGMIPKDWSVQSIEEFVDDMKNGGTPKRGESDYWDNGTVPWLKTGEINNNIIIKSEEHITELGLKNSSAKLLPINSIIMALYGKGTAARIGLLKFEATTNQACCAMICNDFNKTLFLYLFLLFNQKEIENLASGSVQQNLSKDLIANLELVVPPIEIIDNLPFKEIFDTIANNYFEIEYLINLRDTLLPKLMSGEIDVSKINCDLELKYNYMKYLFNQIHTPMSKSVV